MKYLFSALFLLLFAVQFSKVFAQINGQQIKQEQCATMANLANKLSKNSALQASYTQKLTSFNKMMQAQKALRNNGERVAGTSPSKIYTIPIVFHIVLTDPTVVTDDEIMSQLKTLNQDFAGVDPDSTKIPDYFKPLHAHSNIQFCLAQRTPDGDITNGIDRVVTTKTSFSADDNGVKHTATGGIDLWDETKYYNVWVCILGNSILGYGTFPTDGETTEQGVVIHYASLTGSTVRDYQNYNGGKTLTHETGHYFNLYHVWGVYNGDCSGTDFVDDTPTQFNYTTGCYNGIHYDACTTTGNGILYEDYMDYSNDQCLLVFTPDQVDRMEAALQQYRPSLITSNYSCSLAIYHDLDVELKTIVSPTLRICNNNISPVVTIRNRGVQTLTTTTISTVLDNGTPITYNWYGTLVSLDTISITLNSLTIPQGVHTLQCYTSLPNGATDQNQTNDTLVTTVQYYPSVETINESFEGNVFPPAGWDIVNPDKYITWKKVTTASKTGNASVMIDNFDYAVNNSQDYLRLPQVNIAKVDSAFLTFQVAAATQAASSSVNIPFDTLEVLLSKDCGVSYTSLYKKWGATLVTHAAANTSFFIPSASEWRKDSVNLTPYINSGNVLIAFRNITEHGNNIYLDDVNIRTITINQNLIEAGFLVTPNPAQNNLQVQFYPNPTNLQGISLYNITGQKLAEINTSAAQGATSYNFDISKYAVGMYVVRAVFANKVMVKKVIKN